MFLEGALVKHLQTKCTGEMLQVEFLAHGADAALLNRLLARLAHLVLGDVIVVLTIRLSTVLKVVTFWKCHMAFLQYSDKIVIRLKHNKTARCYGEYTHIRIYNTLKLASHFIYILIALVESFK